jgi:pimeloyl-ACP methyl ester carboxylesterase
MLHHVENGTGPAVVLLHAFPMDSSLWAAQRQSLAQAGYRVITPDLPGFGGSSPADEPPSLDVMADAVVELLDHLGIERAVVGGLSMGGYVAMALLRLHPDRLSAIILADTKAGADAPEAAANRETVAAAVEAAGSAAGIADGMLPNLLGATTRESRPDVVTTVRRWIGAQPAAGVAWAQRAMAARPDSLADIAAFGGPVLVLYGAQDTISPAADAAAMADAARSGGSATTVVEIPAAGHLTAVEDPDAVTHALSGWLATL